MTAKKVTLVTAPCHQTGTPPRGAPARAGRARLPGEAWAFARVPPAPDSVSVPHDVGRSQTARPCSRAPVKARSGKEQQRLPGPVTGRTWDGPGCRQWLSLTAEPSRGSRRVAEPRGCLRGANCGKGCRETPSAKTTKPPNSNTNRMRQTEISNSGKKFEERHSDFKR